MYGAQCTMQNEALVETAIEDYNTYLYSLAQENTNVKMVDIRRFYHQYPQEEWLDWKFYMLSQMGINQKLTVAFKQWCGRKKYFLMPFFHERDKKLEKSSKMDIMFACLSIFL